MIKRYLYLSPEMREKMLLEFASLLATTIALRTIERRRPQRAVQRRRGSVGAQVGGGGDD